MKKILKLSRSFSLTLLMTISLQTFGSIAAMEQQNQTLSPRKQGLLRRLVNHFKETRELYKKRKAGNASAQELKKLEERMKTIKKAAIKAGIVAAFTAAIVVGGRSAYQTKAANIKDKLGKTPLMYAAQQEQGDFDAVKKLIAHGANVKAKDNMGRTPLHYAAEKGGFDTIKELIAHGADIEAKDNKGRTPLHYAAQTSGRTWHNDNTIKELIAHGADIEAKDDAGYTPLNYAAQRDYRAAILELRKAEIEARRKAREEEKRARQ